MVLNFMKPLYLSLHALLKTDIIQGAAYNSKALSLLIVSYTPQLMLSPLIHYSQLVHETRPFIKQEWDGRSLVTTSTILLNQVLFVGIESGLDLKQKLFVHHLETLKLYFSFYYWNRWNFSCKMLYINKLKVLFKA